MTYIIVSKSKKNQELELQKILKQLFNKDITGSPDIHILDPHKQNSIGIEEIKAFQKEMMYRPFEENIQAGVITEAEKLTPQAQNALLKTLENISNFSVFFLCVNNEKNLLPTIRSRGKIIYSSEQIVDLENQDNTESDIENILEKVILEQFNIIEKYSEGKEQSMTLINAVEEVFRKRLELDIKNGNIESSKKNADFLKIIQESREKISANCNRRLTLEAMIVQLNA
jgi:DNA polymerase III delta prime subunit